MNAHEEAQKFFTLAEELRAQADAAERAGRILLMQEWGNRAAE